MIFLIDTNIAVHARDGTPAVLDKLKEHVGSVVLSALCLAELQRGSRRDPSLGPSRRDGLTLLRRVLPVLPFDEAAADRYGRLIERYGWVRGRDFDRMIAAHALSLGATLVTDNEKDFRDIKDLYLVNWTRPDD